LLFVLLENEHERPEEIIHHAADGDKQKAYAFP
jgi:hypothetical protein